MLRGVSARGPARTQPSYNLSTPAAQQWFQNTKPAGRALTALSMPSSMPLTQATISMPSSMPLTQATISKKVPVASDFTTIWGFMCSGQHLTCSSSGIPNRATSPHLKHMRKEDWFSTRRSGEYFRPRQRNFPWAHDCSRQQSRDRSLQQGRLSRGATPTVRQVSICGREEPGCEDGTRSIACSRCANVDTTTDSCIRLRRPTGSTHNMMESPDIFLCSPLVDACTLGWRAGRAWNRFGVVVHNRGNGKRQSLRGRWRYRLQIRARRGGGTGIPMPPAIQRCVSASSPPSFLV